MQVCESSCKVTQPDLHGGAREVSINSTLWNCDYDERLRWAFQIAHSTFKIKHKRTLKSLTRRQHYEHIRQRKRTKYTVPQVDKGTSLHCYYVERWICMRHLFYTFLHNSSEGMFLCLPGELYILTAFFVSHIHSAGNPQSSRARVNNHRLTFILLRKKWFASLRALFLCRIHISVPKHATCTCF